MSRYELELAFHKMYDVPPPDGTIPTFRLTHLRHEAAEEDANTVWYFLTLQNLDAKVLADTRNTRWGER